METFVWKPRQPGGALGDPVAVRLPAWEATDLRILAGKMRLLPPGPARTKLLNEIATRMDIHAAFPGTEAEKR